VRGIHFASFYDFAIGFWKCSENLSFFIFIFIKFVCKAAAKLKFEGNIPEMNLQEKFKVNLQEKFEAN
jgi:hypothetical protein